MEKRELLDKIAHGDEERLVLSRIRDKWEQCQRRNIPTHTAFLTPQEQAMGTELLRQLHAEGYCAVGGYETAERRQLHFLPDWAEQPEEAVRAIRCRWYETDSVSHRDILGSLMGLGITRESVGDILVDTVGHSADLFVTGSAADHILREWSQAGRVKLRVEEISLHDVHLPRSAFKEIGTTLPSLRLDSVVSAAFGLSRSEAAETVEKGRVQVNWQDVTKCERTVAEGDVITARGYGKCEMTAVGGITKKGRRSVTIRRFI